MAWPLIANFSCSLGSESCARADNMGWRYLLFALGAITLSLWLLRFFAFDLFESPRYLIGKGRDGEAVQIMHRLASYNGTKCSLTLEQLQAVGDVKTRENGKSFISQTSNYTMDHIRSLFATPKLAYSTTLLVSLWSMLTQLKFFNFY